VPWSELRLGDRTVQTRPAEVPRPSVQAVEAPDEEPAVAL
jgi:hypothetical protein